jgi:calcium permeable stress-gated cation channel
MADNSTAISDEEESQEVIIPWSAVWVTALISILQSLVFYGFFLYQRTKEKAKNSYALYEPRYFQKRHRSPGAFADVWWKDTWNVEQEELLRCVGLDSYMFLRFLRLGARMAGMGTLCSLVLLPIYATGNAEGESTMEFNSLTLARVEAGSNRMWATVTAWCIFVAFILHEFWSEWLVRCES